jgi:hypothetical protein
MSFVHDHQVPMDLAEAGENILPLGQVERGDHLRPLEPLIATVLVPDVPAAEDVEGLPKVSLSSRCHWKARLAGPTIRTRSARPRSLSFNHCVDYDNLRAKQGVWMLRWRTEAMISIEPEFSAMGVLHRLGELVDEREAFSPSEPLR